MVNFKAISAILVAIIFVLGGYIFYFRGELGPEDGSISNIGINGRHYDISTNKMLTNATKNAFVSNSEQKSRVQVYNENRLKAYATHGKHVSYIYFYALQQTGAMEPGKRYFFKGCVYYDDGDSILTSENIFLMRPIYNVDFRLENKHSLSTLIRFGGQYCGNIDAEMDIEGNVAVVGMH